jgi:hypothetical protein
MYKYVLAAAFFVSTSAVCFAAQEFYVVTDQKGHGCEINHEKPDGVTKIMVGTSSYSTRADAKAAKRAAPECADTDPKAPKAQSK